MCFERICPVCEKKISYTRKYNFEQANKQNKLCYECTMKNKSGNPEEWFRHCPTCNCKITYTNKGNMTAAKKVNKKCLKCSRNEKQTNTEFSKKCPTCDNIIYYKNKVSLDESIERGSKCKPCVSKETSQRQIAKGGNKGMMIEKYGEEEGIRRFNEAENKRKEAYIKYWHEHPDELQKLINRREGYKSKFFFVHGIRCQGNAERIYLEKLVSNNEKLPERAEGILTPYGYYFPDFEYQENYVEVKSTWTFDVLKKVHNIQYLKIKWVIKNVKPIHLIVVDMKKSTISKIENF